MVYKGLFCLGAFEAEPVPYQSRLKRVEQKLLMIFFVYLEKLFTEYFCCVPVVWSSRNYAIIIDSGSTGSRLLAFTFRRGAIDQQLQLEDELWAEVKPGKN